ncbi:Uncharacterised protein [Candidatus Gugararchaeum adminiculabundum]|nr:Uncharacterised protein [Candidatus Gugararchaeum adminiculabundum]
MKISDLMSRDTMLIIGASVLIFILMMGYVFLTLKPPTYETSISFSRLSPTKDFPLLGGENYTYEFRGPSQSPVRTEYSIKDSTSQSCAPVQGKVPELGVSISTCLSKSSGKPSQILVNSQNGSFLTNASVDFFFSDLTMSLKDGFVWQHNTTSMVTGDYPFNQTLVLNFKVLGTEKFKGRDAFKVEFSSFFANERGISSTDIPSQMIYVDQDKRVILYSSSNESEFELIGAPFNMTCVSANGTEKQCPQ